MKKTQNAKDNMYKKLLAFFAVTTNASIWAAFARLVEKTAKLTTNFRFKLTTDFRSKLTSGFRSKLTT